MHSIEGTHRGSGCGAAGGFPFTVRAWRAKGFGPRFLKMGRAVRYRVEDVQDYEKRVLVNPTTTVELGHTSKHL